MTDLTPIDVTTIPDLARIVEEVETTKKPRKLKREKKTAAVIIPTPQAAIKKKRTKTKADYEAFLISRQLKDVDAEKLIADIYRWRQEGPRPVDRP